MNQCPCFKATFVKYDTIPTVKAFRNSRVETPGFRGQYKCGRIEWKIQKYYKYNLNI